MTTPTDPQQSENASPATENSTGTARLFNLDLPALKKTGKIFPEQADLSGINRILDIACGAGEWVSKTAQAYPQMQVVGIDSSAQTNASEMKNASFRVMNPLPPLNFPDASFDLVNARFIASLVPKAAWPGLIHECLRITRPGGIVRLTETDMPITNSPAYEKLSAMISHALWLAKYGFSPDGRILCITPILSRLLGIASCQDIQSVTSVINFSAGMEAHDELAQDFAKTYQHVQPFLIKMGTTNQEEVDQVYQQMLAEMQSSSFCAVGFYLTVWGRKV